MLLSQPCAYSLGVSGLARKFGLTPDQFGENLRDNYQRHETQQHPIEPDDTAENYLSRSVCLS